MQPLEGIRVLDFSRHMAGAYGTVLLSDYGADVIKIESLPNGDPSRNTGTAYVEDVSGLFLIWNRGKRSVALDLRKPEALEVIYELAKTCDVVVENYRPGIVDKIGVSYEQLSKINDQLIYVSVSAFGQEGPWAGAPGTDPVVQAMSGVMSVTGEADGEPLYVGVPIADFTGSQVQAQAVLLGLLARQKTGKGQKIDVSMLYALMSSLTTRLASYWYGGEEPTRHGNAHSVSAPYQAFETSDGWVVAGAWGGEGDSWSRFCRAVGRTDLLEDPRFTTNVDRVRNRKDLSDILDAEFVKKTTAEWRELFNAEKALFGPILTIPQAIEQEQAKVGNLVTMVEHPQLGSIPMMRPVIDLHETPGSIKAPPPLLGQHSVEVLGEIGYARDEIERLIAGGILGVPAETTSSV